MKRTGIGMGASILWAESVRTLESCTVVRSPRSDFRCATQTSETVFWNSGFGPASDPRASQPRISAARQATKQRDRFIHLMVGHVDVRQIELVVLISGRQCNRLFIVSKPFSGSPENAARNEQRISVRELRVQSNRCLQFFLDFSRLRIVRRAP